MNEKVILGRGTKYPLNGILTLPDNCSSKVPDVVLVHGSGPLDMDESIGANKPFRDIEKHCLPKESRYFAMTSAQRFTGSS
jgi:hypothetical protein